MILKDIFNKEIRLTDERLTHITENHPEMINQLDNIINTLLDPLIIVKSKSDSSVEMYYNYYLDILFGDKYLCVVVKNSINDSFLLTAYFTDTIKKGEIIWQRK